ncbi:MAG: porin [Planctomycetes bacterium]|nr:porin [Planctomycetota bacterium]
MPKAAALVLFSLAVGIFFSNPTLNAQETGEAIIPADQPVYAEVFSAPEVIYDYPSRCDEKLQNWLDDRFENNWLFKHTVSVTGWVEQGLSFNGDRPANSSNRPVGFNDRANEYLLNQFYLSFSRKAEFDPYDHGFGFGVDLFWGSDARFTKAHGLDSSWQDQHAIYQLSMPQMYLEFYLPYDGGIDVKLGRFYSILGYESIAAPDNFFYSHSYTFLYGEPFTHTGLLADWHFDDRFSASFGVHNGWNDFNDPDANPFGLLGGLSFTNDSDSVSIAYAFSWSNESQNLYDRTATGRVPFTTEGDRFVQSLVARLRLSEKLTYVFQTDYGTQSNGAAILNPVTLLPDRLQDAQWYGINQYLIYKINDRLTAGLRYEWFHDDDGARVPNGQDQGLAPVANVTAGTIQRISGLGSIIRKGDYHAVTLGVNWKLRDCLTIRPELRIDISRVRRNMPPGTNGVFDDLSDNNQVTISTDVVYRC